MPQRSRQCWWLRGEWDGVFTCARNTARSCTSLQPCLTVSTSAAAAAADVSRCRERAAACSASKTSHSAYTSLQRRVKSLKYKTQNCDNITCRRRFAPSTTRLLNLLLCRKSHTNIQRLTAHHAPIGCSSCLTIATEGTHLKAAVYKLIWGKGLENARPQAGEGERGRGGQ